MISSLSVPEQHSESDGSTHLPPRRTRRRWRQYKSSTPRTENPRFLGPFMVQLLLLGVPKRGFGSHPCRAVSNSYQITVYCHGRGREFESRRPRHSFQKSCTNFAATNEGAKGCIFAPLLHPFSSIRAVFTSSAFTGLTTLTRVRWSSFQKRRPAQGPLLAQRVLLARLPACKHPAWTVTRNVATVPASP